MKTDSEIQKGAMHRPKLKSSAGDAQEDGVAVEDDLVHEARTIKMTISDQRKVFAIKEQFNTLFPTLKLDFYGKPHTSGGANSLKLIHGSNHTLEECRNLHNDGVVTIYPQMSCSDLEEQFMSVYGIKIKVSRCIGSEPIDAESLTLEERNRLD